MAEVVANGIRHHVQRLGTGGPPVVFLHGLVMDNLSSWYFTAGTRVAQHTTAVLTDLRGHGRSERPAAGYRVGDLLDDLTGVLDALEVPGPVVLVGNSFGGQLATAWAVANPARCAGLVLVDAHLGREGWADAMTATLSLEGDDADAAIATHFATWLGRHSKRKATRLANTARALIHDTTLLADLRASPALTDDDLRRVTAPVLALYGETSDLVDEAARIGALWPQATVRVLPDASHSILWEHTEAVVEAIVGFARDRVEASCAP